MKKIKSYFVAMFNWAFAKKTDWHEEYITLFQQAKRVEDNANQLQGLLMSYEVALGPDVVRAYMKWFEDMTEENHSNIFKEVSKREDSGDWRSIYEAVKGDDPRTTVPDSNTEASGDDVDGGKSGN